MKRLLLLLLFLSTGPLPGYADETTLSATPTPTITPCSIPTAVFGENFDTVTPPALPAGWVASNAVDPDAIVWTSSHSGTPLPPADSPSNAVFSNDPATVSDKRLESPTIPIWNPFAQLTFRNNYNLENTFDGGVLEVSVNGGAFTDLLSAGGSFVAGGYSGSISTIFNNPIGGRMAWTGNSGGFQTATVNLPPAAAGGFVKLRWRMASDASVSAQGWRIDGLVIFDCPQPVTVSLPTDTFDNSVPISTVIIEPVVTSYLHPGLGYPGFSGEFTFDSAVVSFASPPVQAAGITGQNGWTVGGFVMNTGPGTIKTLLVQGLLDGNTPLVGSGTLFNLRMVRVSGFPGTSSLLTWRPAPEDFAFLDAELNTHAPSQTNGLIGISGTGPTPTASPVSTPSPSPTPKPTPSPTGTPGPPVTVSLPIDTFDNGVPISTLIIEPVTTTLITASLNYIFFQGDFTYDPNIVSFASPPIQAAGLTTSGWTVSANTLAGPGSLRTFRVSAFVNDGVTPLNGTGILFNLRMFRVSGIPGTSSSLTWSAFPNDFEFADTDLDAHAPNQNNGLITISGSAPTPTPTAVPPSPTPTPDPTPVPTASPSGTPAPPVKVSLPTANFDSSVPISTIINLPVVTTFISANLDYRGFQADFTFDSAVAAPTPAGNAVQPAGLTALGGSGWTVSANVLNTGPGTLKTLRVSAFANDGATPLSGAGTLFLVHWKRVGSAPASTPLTWSAFPNDFEFIDGDLNAISPNQSNGLITITGPSPTPTPTPPPISISGSIRNCASSGAAPVPGVILTLTGTVSGSTSSDASGNYTFAGLPGGGSYLVTPAKGALSAGTGHINTVDLIAAQRHFLNIEPLSGCRLKAADVNGDNLINNVDLTAILRFSLGNSAGNVGKYQFTPLSRSYSTVLSNQTGQNFDVIVMGDVAAPFGE